jgi:hypothetical protein
MNRGTAARPKTMTEGTCQHLWSYELVPVDADATVVTETFDCSRSPEWLRKAVRCGERWTGSMTRTLEKLDVLSRDS